MDTSELTTRERGLWQELTEDLRAPCPDTTISLKQCLDGPSTCRACRPAAEFLVRELRRGKTAEQAEGAFTLRFSPESRHELDTKGAPWMGAEAPVLTLVEWADYRCGHCAALAPQLEDLAERYGSQLRIAHFPYVLHQSPDGERLALAGLAAARMGRFWTLHPLLFRAEDASEEALVKLAAEAGLDAERFRRELRAPEGVEVLGRARAQATELGLDGTPMLYIDGRHFDLELFDTLEDLAAWIDLEIELKTGAKPAPPAAPSSSDGKGGGALDSMASSSADVPPLGGPPVGAP